MKRLLPLILLMSAVCAYAGDKHSRPDKLYVCGDMTEWKSPADGGTRYELTDPDGDAIYTGSFQIPAQDNSLLEFVIFIENAGWDSTEYIFGDFLFPLDKPLFSNRDWIIGVSSFQKSGQSRENIIINNWQGGVLTLSADLRDYIEYAEFFSVAAYSETQPATDPIPDNLYLIGNFNGWKLPSATNANGAVVIDQQSQGHFYAHRAFPAGDIEMVFCSLDRATGKYTFYNGPEKALTLTSGYYPGNSNNLIFRHDIVASESLDKAKRIRIKGWSGEKITVAANFEYKYFDIRSDEAPEYQLPDNDGNIYLIYTVDDGDTQIKPIPIGIYNDRFKYYASGQFDGKNISFIFSTENSINPSPENCWGSDTDDIIRLTNLNEEHFTLELKARGKPFRMELAREGILFFNASWPHETCDITVRQSLEYSELPAEIYLIGAPQNWNINDGTIALKHIDDDRYETVIELPKDESLNFLFFLTLGDWDGISVGSQIDKGSAPARWPFYAIDNWAYLPAVYGKGSWDFGKWEGGKLKISVNLRSPSVNLWRIKDESGIDDISAPEDSQQISEWYTIQGIRLPGKPSAKGLYINRRGSQSEKVFIP